MRAEQTVNEMAEEILSRQARALAKQTGKPLVGALEAVLETAAGHQLEELRDGPHQHEEARYWQANLLFERVSEQAGHPISAGSTGPGLRSFSRAFIHPRALIHPTS
ncbi:MAG TPA: hypothetical protein VKA82_08100 [Rubrobacter sp.]|jgi:hypothetical protein|nr:hypothetical protein [Rubrobacter sp.]